ncbi:MAG: oligoendopeptidase F [Clostridia bacterium]|nr:oligoendopeptidase F [Clostridia bacterium]
MAKPKQIPKRNEVKKEYTWALEDIFATDELWNEALEELRGVPEKISKFVGRLGESAETLYEYLRYSDEVEVKLVRAAEYCMRRADEDTGNSYYQGMKGRFMGVYVAVSSAASFDTPELLAIPDEVLEGFYTAKPELKLYRRKLDKLRSQKDHVLSDAEEKLLASVGEVADSASEIAGTFRNADLKFPSVHDAAGNELQVTQGSYVPLLENPEREVRRQAFESLHGTFDSYKNTSAAFLNAQMKQLTFFSRARKYGSNLEAALSRTEVPESVYHNLIDTVNANLKYLHRYVALRKKLMGLDEMHMYDLYMPIIADADTEIPYEKAKEIIVEALAPLGEEYLTVLKSGFENRWIDVYENEGKRSGAYSAGGDPHPYVLLNQKDTLDSMFTIAHEMGHSMHTYYSIKNQPVAYRDYVIFVAEVASTCNEVLLMRHLLGKTTDKKEKAYLLNHFLEQFRGTVYRQTMFAEFELWMNEKVEAGETLTADVMNEAYYALNKKYFGDDLVVDRLISVEWARIPHFFYNYYVFQYATGFSAAVAIANRILAEGKPAVDDYLRFLSGGSSTDPISLLKIAGVDMASPKPIEDGLKLFNELLDEMEELTR